MNIGEYIQTGIVESYVLGLASQEEVFQFERLTQAFPELKIAQSEFEYRLETFAMMNAVPPPPGIKEKIEDRLRELPAIRPVSRGTWTAGADKQSDYIDVKESSSHIRVHKYWRPVFIGIFILSKILLAAAIYYFLQFRSAGKEIKQLQEQVQAAKPAADKEP